MKIAVACDGLSLSAHAARCDSFMCYTVDRGIITECRNLPNMSITSHESARLLIGLGFDVVVSGGIDMDMANELCDASVEVVAGIEGTPREAVEAYVNHTLMGVVPLCCAQKYASADNLESDGDEEKDIEDAFDRLAERLSLSEASA